MLQQTLTKGQPDWHNQFNANAAVSEDKLTIKALCTYDTDDNAFVLELLNVPASGANAEEIIYPDSLPDLFSVVAKFPSSYVGGAVIRIGAVDFTPIYPAFLPGDIQLINFDKVNNKCFFASSGGTVPADKVTYNSDDMPEVENVKAALDFINNKTTKADAENVKYINTNFYLLKNVKETLDELLALSAIYNRIYEGVDLSVKFASEIAAAPHNGNVWAWIQARIQEANYWGIYVGDYIPFVCSNGYAIKAEVAGIDTYYKYGDQQQTHHIDFIARDLWPDTHVYNKANYNNGTSVSPYTWLASDLYAFLNSLQMNVPNTATADPTLVAVDYRATGVYDKLPIALQNVISTKCLLLPQRYAAGSLLTADNTWGWVDAGKLWIPSEVEVYGMEHWGSKNGYSGGGYQQYPIFSTNMKRIKGAGDGGGGSAWWLSSAMVGYSTSCACVGGLGDAILAAATDSSIRAPLCFRIRAA
jgi:hypothetical protein